MLINSIILAISSSIDSLGIGITYGIKNTKISSKAKTHQKTAVDVNVGHFNYTGGKINVLPVKLQKLYKRIKHYQRMLARKREVNGKLATKSNNYFAVRTKLQRDYRKVANIQNDLLQNSDRRKHGILIQ